MVFNFGRGYSNSSDIPESVTVKDDDGTAVTTEDREDFLASRYGTDYTNALIQELSAIQAGQDVLADEFGKTNDKIDDLKSGQEGLMAGQDEIISLITKVKEDVKELTVEAATALGRNAPGWLQRFRRSNSSDEIPASDEIPDSVTVKQDDINITAVTVTSEDFDDFMDTKGSKASANATLQKILAIQAGQERNETKIDEIPATTVDAFTTAFTTALGTPEVKEAFEKMIANAIDKVMAPNTKQPGSSFKTPALSTKKNKRAAQSAAGRPPLTSAKAKGGNEQRK